MKTENLQVESGVELSKGMKVFFIGENLPMEVKAVNENFAICTRKLHKSEDSDLLNHQVRMGAYMSLADAYKDLKSQMVYTIIDLKYNNRGADNYGGWCEYKNEEEIKEVLEKLQSGEIEISHRNRCDYNLDIERTLNQN